MNGACRTSCTAPGLHGTPGLAWNDRFVADSHRAGTARCDAEQDRAGSVGGRNGSRKLPWVHTVAVQAGGERRVENGTAPASPGRIDQPISGVER